MFKPRFKMVTPGDWCRMRVHPSLSCFLAVVFVAFAHVGGLLEPAIAQEMRTWRDSSGSYSVEATLAKQDAEAVFLKKQSGEEIRVPKSRLSAADLGYLKGLAKPGKAHREKTIPIVRLTDPKGTLPAGSYKLTELQKLIGVPVFLDSAELDLLGVALETEITLPQAEPGENLGDQLDKALRPEELSWQALPTLLLVSTRARLESKGEIAVYRFKGNVALNVIQQEVAPDSWLALGGTGALFPLSPFVMISQSPVNQRAIQKKFGVKSLAVAPKQLVNEKKSVTVKGQMSLATFAENMAGQLGRRVRIDTESLENIGLSGNEQINLDLEGVSASDLLDCALHGVACGWFEDKNEIVITSRNKLRSQTVRKRLVLKFGRSNQAGQVMQMIIQMVAPDTWQANGGAGSIAVSGANSFNIQQSPPVQRQLENLAEMLRAIR